MDKRVYTDQDSLATVLKGMQLVGEVVGSTYGPNGRNVIIEDEDGKPHVTKDGVTVAKSMSFRTPLINLGASLVKDAAIKSLKEVGDGTTTTAILAAKAAEVGYNMVADGKVNPFYLRQWLEKLTSICIDKLKESSTPVDKTDTELLMKVALNASNGDTELSEKIVSLFSEIGKDGVVSVKDSSILGVHTQIVDGMSIDRGYTSPMFCTGQSAVELSNCYILISKKTIREYRELVPFLQKAIDEVRPVLLMVPEVDNAITEMFLTNIYQGNLVGGCVIQAPYSNERMQDFFRDLGIASGAITGDKDWNEDYLFGEADLVTVGRLSTEFKGLRYDKDTYLKHKAYLEDMVRTQPNKFLADKVSERLAMFSGSIGYIHVGASSETELLELKDRVDDVIHAVQAALKEGVVQGGGQALKTLSDYFREEEIKSVVFEEKLAMKAMIEILKTPGDILGTMRTSTQDPTKVVYTALKNAISVAGMLFTSSYIITDER